MDALDTDFLRRRNLVGDLLATGATSSNTPTAATTSTGNNSNPLGGVVGTFTSVVGGITSVIVPSSSATSTSQLPTTSSSSSTGLTTSTTSKSASATSTTSTSTPSTTSTPTSTSTSTPTLTPIVHTSTDGTSIVYVTSFATSSASPTAAAPQSFLQNKPLEAGVFTLVGIVVMVIIFVIITFTIRRRRRDRLESVIADAVTFDPSVTDRYADEESRLNTIEKYRLSGSSSGHSHGFGYGPQLAHAPPIAPQYSYYGQGYEQQAAYRGPSPQGTVHNNDIPVTTGGANLIRKYSDRKPVPPLLLNPVYDPSRSPVLPSHYYMENKETLLSQIPRSTSPSALVDNATTSVMPNDSEEDPYAGVLKVVNN